MHPLDVVDWAAVCARLDAIAPVFECIVKEAELLEQSQKLKDRKACLVLNENYAKNAVLEASH